MGQQDTLSPFLQDNFLGQATQNSAARFGEVLVSPLESQPFLGVFRLTPFFLTPGKPQYLQVIIANNAGCPLKLQSFDNFVWKGAIANKVTNVPDTGPAQRTSMS